MPGSSRARRAVLRLGARVVRAALTRYARGGAPPVVAGSGGSITILLMSAWGLGGTIRSTLGLASHLAVRHDVQVLSMVRRREEPRFAFPPGVVVTAVDDRRPGVSAGLVQRLLRRVPSALMPPSDGGFRALSLWSDVRLAHRLRRAPAGILLATRPGLNVIAAEAAPRRLVPVGLEHMHLSAHSPRLTAELRRAYPRLAAVVVLTEGDRLEYARAFGTAPRVECIPNAVPRHDGPAARPDATRILAAGRLTRQKGFDMLVPAFARVSAAHPEWTLRICGGGPERGALRGLAREHDVDGRVELPGPVGDVQAEMAEASLFVLSSRFEGLPMVLLEAMDKGMAVVSFDCPTGPRELIDDHRNGILVPPDDVEGLADAMLELIEDPALRRRCGAAARETAREYALEAVGPRWDRLLGALSGAGS
jgi:glycosyltransferase involved in cell wall biosynthesis